MDSIVATSSAYKSSSYRYVATAPGRYQIIRANPSRWSLRFVAGRVGGVYISPFNQDDDYPGIVLAAGDEIDFYLSRDPVLTGLAWYLYVPTVFPPSTYVEAWETTPNGT